MACHEERFRFNDEISECSMRSKARIDSLFEDSRSFCSSSIGGRYTTISKSPASVKTEEAGSDDRNSANDAVQARIEAMFASIEDETRTSGESAASILTVKYIGAAPVGGRVASIRGLQEPLRQLLEHVDGSVTAELEISQRGLSFRTSEVHEKTNPFRRIAVWSALRLRCKRFPNGDLRHGFLPLIPDDRPPIATIDGKHADLYRFMRGLDANVNRYPPIFAVVMRRPGAAKLLECHAFSCGIEEDAIAAAATLYRALLADLDASRRRPRQTNGLGSASLVSVASSLAEPSIVGGRSVSGDNGQRLRPGLTSLGSSSLIEQPVRPPRSKKISILESVTVSGSRSGPQADVMSVRSPKIEKASRKKKILEIKAEDILEARSRKEQFDNSRVTDHKKIRGVGCVNGGSRILDNDKNFGNCNNATKNKERNLTNKMMLRKNGKFDYESGSKLIDVEKPEYSVWQMNNYVKLRKMSRSFDYDVNPEIQYLFGDKNGADEKDVNEDCYESNNGSYGINVGDGLFNYSGSKLKDPDGVSSKDIGNNGWLPGTIERRENSIYSDKLCDKRSSRDKIYEKHFRDADKIYSIDNPLMSSAKSHYNRDANTDNVGNKYTFLTQSNSSIRHRSDEGIENNINDYGDRESCYGFERSDGINTMDKPIGKQLKNDVSETRESNRSKVRKRRRTCSEPPSGRTDNGLEYIQEPKLTRSQSELEVDRGDPMTRVELPRRCSFLKPGGSARLLNTVQGGTPLGFTEFFDEFRNQEGLTSLDDILTAIIDPEGMSFKDLKPLYKEFLLKLAATLSQDELYQKSASIMRRRRRRQRRRSTRKPCLIGRAIKRSMSRLKGGGPTEFTSVIFPAKKLTDSFDSSSSCDINNHRTCVLASRLSRKHPSWRNIKSVVGQTTSEDSDAGRRLARNGGAGANRSSSGYVSCSECSYDSESCTCVSADKCYCSLPRRVSTESVQNTVVCACDTDSCSDSNKCYCARKSPPTTILEQLRQRGIVPSESTLSRTVSPDRPKTTRTSRIYASSKSLEFLNIRPSPGRSSSDNLALDYDLFRPGKKSQRSSAGSEKVLVVSARDLHGRLVYVGGSDGDKYHPNGTSRRKAHHEALSVKKSAEIAAVFGPSYLRPSNRTSSISSVKSSVSLEAGLGYLP